MKLNQFKKEENNPNITGFGEIELPEFLMKKLEEQYEKKDQNRILEGFARKRYTTLRVNTIKSDANKIKKELEQFGIEFETVPWSEEALVIKNKEENAIKALEMYENGEIYLQSLSSMLPPILLKPTADTDILDMTAAPGSKTTQMAALCENKARITACEKNPVRAERLKYNLEKQGATSVYVMVTDSRKIDDFFSFDTILLDAPCSGSGTLQLYGKKSEYFTQKLLENSIKTQTDLLKKAINILKSGGEMVYSTCSILACENEEIVAKALKEKKVEIVPIPEEEVKYLPKLPTQIEGTVCVCPDSYFEGFFVAKLRKK